jgi:hypothetical protein
VWCDDAPPRARAPTLRAANRDGKVGARSLELRAATSAARALLDALG